MKGLTLIRKDFQRNHLFSVGLFVLFFFIGSDGRTKDEILYVALGDSYTIGTGITPQVAWPSLLEKDLQAKGIPVRLVNNLARAGWSSGDLWEGQLPQLRSLQPTFVTLLIGANDVVREVRQEDFSRHLKKILDEIQEILPQKDHVVLLTIPDFSITPSGQRFGSKQRDRIVLFNDIIVKEAKSRRLKVVDLFSISHKMGTDSSLLADDGLHPSFKAHAMWEKKIFPVVYELFNSK